jgi:hypothetical protein
LMTFISFLVFTKHLGFSHLEAQSNNIKWLG